VVSKNPENRPSGNVKRHRRKRVKVYYVSDGRTWFEKGWVMPSHKQR
jgi:hypothetical protein